MSTHRCPAIDCEANIPNRLLMCPTHWQMIPIVDKNKVWTLLQPGQAEGRVAPSAEYIDHVMHCVDMVAKQAAKDAAAELRFG